MSNLYKGLAASQTVPPSNSPAKAPEPDTCEHVTNMMLEHTIEELGKAISGLEIRLNSVLNPVSEPVGVAAPTPQVDGTLRRKLFDLRDRLDNQIRWVNEITSRINV